MLGAAIHHNKSYFEQNDNENLTDVFTGLFQIGSNDMAGFNGELPYTFTPGKSLLLIVDGGHDPSFTGKNFPDAIFIGKNFSICYWRKNPSQKINIKIENPVQASSTLLIKEW